MSTVLERWEPVPPDNIVQFVLRTSLRVGVQCHGKDEVEDRTDGLETLSDSDFTRQGVTEGKRTVSAPAVRHHKNQKLDLVADEGQHTAVYNSATVHRKLVPIDAFKRRVGL